MPNTINILIPFRFLFTLSVLFCSCQQETPLPPNNAKPENVLYCELIAGEQSLVRVGRSKPVTTGTNNEFEPVRNAVVTLMNGNEQTIETLTYDASADGLMGTYRGTTLLQAGQQYKLQAAVPDMKTTYARTYIPTAFDAALTDTIRTVLNGRAALKFHFKIRANAPGGKQFIVLEALKQACYADSTALYNGNKFSKRDDPENYNRVKTLSGVLLRKDTICLDDYLRIPCYTQDMNADNNQIGGLNENFNRILFTQNSPVLSTDLYLNAAAINAVPDDELIPKGRIIVYVRSTSKAYYDFLLTYEKVVRNPGLNSLFQAIQLKGNTLNGLGIVGGLYQHTYYLYYDDLN
ncbi:DUF4249 family protein [Chitinophaga defluvii]|uniref:DUF4249 family protein n=1 Tax=Chitinophaga defluvii TaxID=3163343 RepID=A0ABV2T3D9_9BACT